jgi:hypothetical protein
MITVTTSNASAAFLGDENKAVVTQPDSAINAKKKGEVNEVMYTMNRHKTKIMM